MFHGVGDLAEDRLPSGAPSFFPDRCIGRRANGVYCRLCARRGKLRAAVALGHTILVAAYHMLADGTFDEDLGADYLDRLDKRRTSNQLIRRLNSLSFNVQLTIRVA